MPASVAFGSLLYLRNSGSREARDFAHCDKFDSSNESATKAALCLIRIARLVDASESSLWRTRVAETFGKFAEGSRRFVY